MRFISHNESWRYCQFLGKKSKGWISKLVFQGNKARQFFRKTNISYPLISTRACAYQGVRNGNKAKRRISKRAFQGLFTRVSHVCVSEGKKCSFFGKFDVLCFLETTVVRFALLPYYRRIMQVTMRPTFLEKTLKKLLDIKKNIQV